ncbi:L-lactate permease [Nocardiopsis sp. RV163]|uniref:L-lactate permease n=1 Tax=Nocardiopsis sp. RV163 TaxID=1661388 RepID=UPI00064C1F35
MATQAVGGAAGNMITVHNVVAASAVVGLAGREGDLIRQSLLPMTYYVLLAGSVSYVLVCGLGPDTGTVTLLPVLAFLAALVLLTRMADANGPASGTAVTARREAAGRGRNRYWSRQRCGSGKLVAGSGPPLLRRGPPPRYPDRRDTGSRMAHDDRPAPWRPGQSCVRRSRP